MYTMIPFRSRRDMSRAGNSLLDDRFFRSFFDMNDFMGNAGFRVDIRDKHDHYELEAELPGVSQENIELNVDNDTLTIAADLNTSKKEDSEGYYYSERRVGHVERSFSLEGIEQDKISADYKNGVLTVSLPKSQPAQPKSQRRIAIGAGNTAENKQ